MDKKLYPRKNLQLQEIMASSSFTRASNWSKQNALPLLPNIEPALQRCASSGLYYKVTTDGDISAALASLFQKAVQTARLTQ